MGTIGQLYDTEIDIAIDEQDEGHRSALELADRIRLVATQDPELAQHLVDQLIVGLDRAMGGTFREHLDGATRGLVERALAESETALADSETALATAKRALAESGK